MVVDEEYIDISSLPINFVKESYVDHLKAFQIQPQDYTATAIIMEIGRLANDNVNTLICEFNTPDYHLAIVNCIHTLNSLQETASTYRFPIIRLIVSKQILDKYMPVGELHLNFHTFVHRNSAIDEHLSTISEPESLSGYFSLTLHYDDKLMILETYKKWVTTKKMIDIMVGYVLDTEVKQILNRKLKF